MVHLCGVGKLGQSAGFNDNGGIGSNQVMQLKSSDAVDVVEIFYYTTIQNDYI
jgi:hypothetical protein